MSHILDPKRLLNDDDYCAALDELEGLMTADPIPLRDGASTSLRR